MLTVIGVDVSKDTLVYCTRDGQPSSISNSSQGIKKLLAKCAPGRAIAMEATGRYHRLLADTACARGIEVFVLNPKDVNRYATSLSPRAANDNIAARVIAGFASERKCIPYATLPAFVEKIKDMGRTRSSLVADATGLTNRAREHSDIAAYLRQARDMISRSIDHLNSKITEQAKHFPQYQRLSKVPGFGPVVTPYIAAMLASGIFPKADSFVAYIGLDVKVKESGKFRGRRRLTKRGDPEARRLLYLAAMAAARKPGPFSEMRQHYLDKGFTKTEATVFIARKLARVAWAIYKKGECYRPERVRNQNQPRPQESSAQAEQEPIRQVRPKTRSRSSYQTKTRTQTPKTEPKGRRSLDTRT